MKLKNLLTKTLLVAAGLLVGASAWADSKMSFYSNDFSDDKSLSLISVSADSYQTLSLVTGDATYGKYVMQETGDRTRSVFMSLTSLLASNFVDYTDYTVEFDAAFRSGATTRTGGNSLILKSTGSTDIFKMATPTTQVGSSGDLVFSVTGTDKTITLSASVWYHFKFEITASAVTYTITIASNGGAVSNGTGTLDITDSRISQIFFDTARSGGRTLFDNVDIYAMVSGAVSNAPTFTFSSVSGANRIYTITNPNGEGTLYYTTAAAVEAPAVGDAAYSSTTDASKEVTYSESGIYYAYVVLDDGTTTSVIASQEVATGVVTLNAPTYTVTDMVLAEDGFYYPRVSFTSDQTNLEGKPTATLDKTSYTFTAPGSVTVTATADGYTSNSVTYTVSNAYSISKTIDFGAMTASNFSDTEVWASATGAPRDYWTNRAAAIPADVTYYKIKDEVKSSYSADVIDGITITSIGVRNPEVYIGYGLLTPYTAVSGSGNNMTFTVNGGVASDFIVYNGWNNYGSGTFNTVQAGNATFNLYRYDTMLRTIKVYSAVTSVSKTITAAGWATYCSPLALDFSSPIANLTNAYLVTGASGSSLTLTPITGKVPANTGILMEGEGAVTIPVASSSDVDVSGNKLVGKTVSESLAAEGGYVLMNDATNGVGFYKNKNAFTLGANTAYLPAGFDGGGARAFYSFGDEATGIDVVRGEMINAQDSETVYNLAGQRVAKTTKGLYIVNGKKVIIK